MIKKNAIFSSIVIIMLFTIFTGTTVFAATDAEAGDVYQKTSTSYCYDALESVDEKNLYNEIRSILADCYIGNVDPSECNLDSLDENKDYYLIDNISRPTYRSLSDEQVTDVYLSVVFDHPMAFFASQTITMDNDFIYLLTEDSFGNKNTISTYKGELETIVKEIAASANGEDADIDKALAIHDAVCDLVDYSYKEDKITPSDTIFAHSIAGAFYNKEVVCEGYSKLFEAAASYAGLTSYIETGWNVPAGDLTSPDFVHAWNVIKVNGKLYAVDVTWDDGEGVDGNGYMYFALGKSFFKDHSITSAYEVVSYNFIIKLPELNEEDFYSGQTVTEGDFTYQQGAGGVLTLIKYNGTSEKVTVPSTVKNKKVLAIAQGAFNKNDNIEELLISNGIRFLGTETVFGCNSLSKVTFPASLYAGKSNLRGLGGWISHCENIKEYAITGNNNNGNGIKIVDGAVYSSNGTCLILYPSGKTEETLNIPDGVVEIADDACADNFYIKTVNIPDTVTYIGYWAFNCCKNLKKLEIPENCTMTGQFAFNGTAIESIHIPKNLEYCDITGMIELKSITVDSQNKLYYAQDDVLYMKEHIYEPTGETIPMTACAFAPNSDKMQVVIADGTEIARENLFFGLSKKVRRICLPTSLKTMESYFVVPDPDEPDGMRDLEVCFAGELPRVDSVINCCFANYDELTFVTHPGVYIDEAKKKAIEESCKSVQKIIWKQDHVWGNWNSTSGKDVRNRKCLACEETQDEIPATSLKLSRHEISFLDSGDPNKYTIIAKIEPENTTDFLIWELFENDTSKGSIGFLAVKNKATIWLSTGYYVSGKLNAYVGNLSDSCSLNCIDNDENEIPENEDPENEIPKNKDPDNEIPENEDPDNKNSDKPEKPNKPIDKIITMIRTPKVF